MKKNLYEIILIYFLKIYLNNPIYIFKIKIIIIIFNL